MSDMIPERTEATLQGEAFENVRGSGRTETTFFRGTPEHIDALAEAIQTTWLYNSRKVLAVKGKTVNGRGELEVIYNPDVTTAGGDPSEDGFAEELYGVDLIKDIRTNAVFESENAYGLNVAYKAWENAEQENESWNDRQKLLYRMLSKGQESYIETSFVYRRTYFRATTDELALSFTDVNRVVGTPPALTTRMQALIEALPAGEWMKKPPQAEYTGKGRYRLAQDWMYAVKWASIYGGSEDFGITL